MRGIDARRQVIAPDAVAGFAWYSIRFARPAYLAAMRTSDIVTGWMIAHDRKKSKARWAMLYDGARGHVPPPRRDETPSRCARVH